jgi:hypothetical protein
MTVVLGYIANRMLVHAAINDEDPEYYLAGHERG